MYGLNLICGFKFGASKSPKNQPQGLFDIKINEKYYLNIAFAKNTTLVGKK